MTPSPENNEAGRLLDMEDEQNALRAEAGKLRAERDTLRQQLEALRKERDEAVAKLAQLPLSWQDARQYDDHITLRQQLTNAIDERNIARKESTALAEQLAAAHDSRQVLIRENAERVSTAFKERNDAVKERDEAQAYVTKLADIAADLGTERMVLRQRITELESALGQCATALRLMLRYHGTMSHPGVLESEKAIQRADKALPATAPDAQTP